MIHLSNSLQHYKRPEIQEAIAEHASNKEVAARFNDRFGKRPDVLQYPSDVLEMARKGATSFHCSEELWSNPLQLKPLMNRKELDNLRVGWDLVIDIDYKDFQYSQLAADLIIKALRHHNIHSVSIKFSGNKGFHIGMPFEAFPSEYKGIDMKLLFPDATKRIVLYLNEKIKTQLTKKLLDVEGGNIAKIAEKLGVSFNVLSNVDKVKKIANLMHNSFLNTDLGLISSRHMYRMPYSLHEKSGLVSLPIPVDDIMAFDKNSAKPEKLQLSDVTFLDRTKAAPSEAADLFTKAYDATFEVPVADKTEKEYEIPAEAVPEKFFPPCIQKLLLGVEDGRKRTLFILTNFLASCYKSCCLG
ncbi:hypothetical protein J4470_05190 [Candidatus Woesearchaeota archaeon]|nr:hypothetical protein [Candidatus Woesearchaeota archaeon]